MSRPIAVIGECAARYKNALLPYADEVIILPPDPSLAAPVASHPDMLMCALDGRIFASRDYITANPEIFARLTELTGFSVVPSDAKRTAYYPYDISFNALVAGRHLYSYTKYTAAELVECACRAGITPISVKQGYTACSALYCRGTVITDDRSIIRAAREAGTPVFPLTDCNISLPGYDRGFVGGTGGVSQDVLYIFGARESLPIPADRFPTVWLGDGVAHDCGGIKFFSRRAK